MKERIVKICKKHGDLTMEQVRAEKTAIGNISYRCYFCKIEKDRRWKENNREQHIAASANWKANNREKYNEWCREDRKFNKDKYRRYKSNSVIKKGLLEHRRYEVLRNHKLTKEEHEFLITLQKNKCAICKKEETRLGRDGKTITPLCIDHCHDCRKNKVKDVRGLLCHSCNTAIGKFKDNIELLKSAITYLEKHACEEAIE